MRKKNSVKQLGRAKDQRTALIRSQVKDLIKNGYIRTTKVRARLVSQKFDSLMADIVDKKVKKVDEYLRDSTLNKKLESYIDGEKRSGYVNLIKIKNRAGDNSEAVLVELINK